MLAGESVGVRRAGRGQSTRIPDEPKHKVGHCKVRVLGDGNRSNNDKKKDGTSSHPTALRQEDCQVVRCDPSKGSASPLSVAEGRQSKRGNCRPYHPTTERQKRIVAWRKTWADYSSLAVICVTVFSAIFVVVSRLCRRYPDFLHA